MRHQRLFAFPFLPASKEDYLARILNPASEVGQSSTVNKAITAAARITLRSIFWAKYTMPKICSVWHGSQAKLSALFKGAHYRNSDTYAHHPRPRPTAAQTTARPAMTHTVDISCGFPVAPKGMRPPASKPMSAGPARPHGRTHEPASCRHAVPKRSGPAPASLADKPRQGFRLT